MAFKEHISLEIDSNKRIRGTIENPIFHIDHQITFSQKDSKSYWLRLEDIQLPASFYLIDSNNNVFRIAEQGGGTIVITIDPGTYDIIELLTELETQLDANTTNSNDYTLTYDEIRNRMSLEFVGTSTDVTIQTIVSGSTLNEVLGWGKPEVGTITNTDNIVIINVSTDTEGTFQVNINSKPVIIIETNLSSKNYMTPNDIINIGARVPNRAERNEFITYENHRGHRSLLNNKGPIANISFILKDNKGNTLDLNGIDWTANLVIFELTELHKGRGQIVNPAFGAGGHGQRSF